MRGKDIYTKSIGIIHNMKTISIGAAEENGIFIQQNLL